MWALGTESGSFVRATGALHLSVIFPALLFGYLGAESHSAILVQQETNAFGTLLALFQPLPRECVCHVWWSLWRVLASYRLCRHLQPILDM